MNNTVPNSPKIFLSYSRDDETQAKRLYEHLSAYDLDVWFDKNALLPGQAWEGEINRSIEESDFVILLLSKNSLFKRGFFQKELRKALGVLETIPLGHIYILPVRLNNCAIPAQLAPIHYVDFFPNWDQGVKKLLQAIELQRETQSHALTLQKQTEQSPTILLVNDEPSVMNFVVDVWKNSGLKVEYAFNVPQAINMIQNLSPTLIVSDLSHFSSGQLITDRAAFEIMEWAQHNKQDIKLIITTSDISKTRRTTSQKLGAVGICNTLTELNDLIENAVGQKIAYPNGLLPDGWTDKDNTETSKTLISPKVSCSVYISYSHKDIDFVQKLATDLESHGVTTSFMHQKLATGATWSNPTEKMIRSADIMLVIISRSSVESMWVNREIHAGLRREDNSNTPFVIPLLIGKESTSTMPFFLHDRKHIDFQKKYEKGLNNLLKSLQTISEKGKNPFSFREIF